MEWITLLSSQRPGSKSLTLSDSRSAFEQDYDRIIFSHPFRRLQDKTQVHPLPEEDFVHTRLTHSLEVSSVGRSLGKRVGEVIIQRHPELGKSFSLFDFGAIAAAASLAHDLGNPPFGHAGEDAISEFFKSHPYGQSFREKVNEPEWADLISFEGNAQGFRILCKGEYGMRLTFATLGAFTKYPCPAHFPERNKKRRSQKKFGFFQTEREHFKEVAHELRLKPSVADSWYRHPLAFVVEAADDICYSIIDLEDGCRLGLVTLDETVELLSGILREKLDHNKLKNLASLNAKLGTLRAMTIGVLIDACTDVFLSNEDAILDGRFDEALTGLTAYKNSLEAISQLSVERIYRARHVVEIEASGHRALPGLLEEFCRAGESVMTNSASRKYQNLQRLLPPDILASISRGSVGTYEMLRLIIDFISGLTDRHALSIYRRISGTPR